jgi:hypothetical protein
VCFFVCLALPEKEATLKLKTLSPDWELTDATDWPIGKAVRGNREHDRAFLITSGGCSCFISDVKKHRRGRSMPAELETLIQSLLEYVPSLSMLIHCAKGDISRESVVQKERKLVSFNELRGQLSRLKNDVRYVIKGNHSY